MKTHWTERSIKDYLFRIAADFISQFEEKMESKKISQDQLAKRLRVTKGRVSQILNHPGNITLSNIIKISRTLGMKVSIVAYEDDDAENKKGPINSEVFKICWERFGKPRDFWAFQEASEYKMTAANATSCAPPVVTAGRTPDVMTLCSSLAIWHQSVQVIKVGQIGELGIVAGTMPGVEHNQIDISKFSSWKGLVLAGTENLPIRKHA